MATKETLAGKAEGEAVGKPLPPEVRDEGQQKKSGAQLISFGDRVTYTFPYGKEIGSIHFDKARREIFFKGHNIRNLDLEERHHQMLETMRKVLQEKEEGKDFAQDYAQTLDKVIMEKKNRQSI